jgi:hypothetical protein
MLGISFLYFLRVRFVDVVVIEESGCDLLGLLEVSLYYLEAIYVLLYFWWQVVPGCFSVECVLTRAFAFGIVWVL